MDATIDLKTLFIILALIALIVLIIFGIVMVKKLLVTLDKANRILEDVEVISEIASERSKDIDAIISGVAGTVAGVASAAKGNEKTITAIAGIVKSAASIKGMISGNGKDKTDKK